jgi:hypothetical protein
MKRFETSLCNASPAKRAKSESKCNFCDAKFTRSDNRDRHEKSCSFNPIRQELRCYVCDKQFKRADVLKKHIEWHETAAVAAIASAASSTSAVAAAAPSTSMAAPSTSMTEPSTSMAAPSTSAAPSKKSKCSFCSKEFARSYNKNRHEEICQANPNKKKINCHECNKTFQTSDSLKNHLKNHSSSSSPAPMASTSAQQQSPTPTASTSSVYGSGSGLGSDVIEQSSAYRNRVREILIKNNDNILLPKQFLESKRPTLNKIFEKNLIELNSLKFNIAIVCFYTKYQTKDAEIFEQEFTHSTKMDILLSDFEIEEKITSLYKMLIDKMEEFQERDSGWALSKICHIQININKYSPLRGRRFIELPNFIKRRKAVVNINNQDDRCFAHSINASLYPVNIHPDRVTSYPPNTLNFSGLNFPIKLEDIVKFEKQNPTISVNVFGVEGRDIVGPLYHTAQRKSHHVNLLYIKNGDNSHYCWIKNMSR